MADLCVRALPHKAYGLVAGTDACHPTTLYRCTTNLRNTPEWNEIFASFGKFYEDPDRGFVISPAELQQICELMEARNEVLLGTFHSHRCRCAEPSELDVALSVGSELLCYIVSVVDAEQPELGVFRLDGTSYERIPVHLV
jgi:proteasome lid subunit RPN8/RPN11